MSAVPRYPREFGYNGAQMTADEYLSLGETDERYELIDGVVVLSPSPFPVHNELAHEIATQLGVYSKGGGDLRIFPETDLRVAENHVFRPDVSVYQANRLPGRPERLTLPPDLVVEILSASSLIADYITKRDAYDRFGVAEYWVVDPKNGGVRAWRRPPGHPRLHEIPTREDADALDCAALPGFVLDVTALRAIAQR